MGPIGSCRNLGTAQTGVAHAQWAAGDAPWCAIIDYGDGGVSWQCNYRSFEECYPNVLPGNKGSRNINPAGPGPTPQRLPPCTSTVSRIGRGIGFIAAPADTNLTASLRPGVCLADLPAIAHSSGNAPQDALKDDHHAGSRQGR
jgi:hypothetical protein